LEGYAEMEDVEDDSDSDYHPINVDVHQGGDMIEVLESISDLKVFMTQRFNAQDHQFQELHHIFDTQETQFNEMGDQFHRWNTNLAASDDDFLLENDDTTFNLYAPAA